MKESKKVQSRRFGKNYYAVASGDYLKDKTPATQSLKIVSRRLGKSEKTPTASISAPAYIGGKLLSGIAGIAEGVYDLTAGTLDKVFGSGEYADYLFRYSTPTQDMSEALDTAYNPGKVMRFVGDVSTGVGQSATFLIPGVGQALFFTGVLGNSISNAAQTTGEVGTREYIYGTASAVLEWALERYVSGTGKTLESITKSGMKNIGSKLAKKTAGKAAKNTFAGMVAKDLISSAVGEGLEEALGNVFDAGLRRITGVEPNAVVTAESVLYDFAVGMTSGAILGSVSTASQTAYARKRGEEIAGNKARRERLIRQTEYTVRTAANMAKGSDTVAADLAELKSMLNQYANAKDKSGAGAHVALGRMETALTHLQLNILTDRTAEFVAGQPDGELAKLADYATKFFGAHVTVDMLRDVNNPYTRALATMDWAGGVIRSFSGKDAAVEAEIKAKVEERTAAGQSAQESGTASSAGEAASTGASSSSSSMASAERAGTGAGVREAGEMTPEELSRLGDNMKKAEAVAVEVSESGAWKGESATFRLRADGQSVYIAIKRRGDGTFAVTILEKGRITRQTLNESQVEQLLENSRQIEQEAEKPAQDERRTEEEGRGEEDESEDSGENEAERGDGQKSASGEERSRHALSGDRSSEGSGEGSGEGTSKRSEEERDASSERGEAAEESPTEEEIKEYGGSIGSAEEVQRAAKLVKDFKRLDSGTRRAILQLIRSGSGIDRATLSSVAQFIRARPGLHILFAKGHAEKGSYDVLSDGERLILLDPAAKDGKRWRQDTLFHELYHDMQTAGKIGKLNDSLIRRAGRKYAEQIADRYTKFFNGVSVTEYLNGRTWTDKSFREYFEHYSGISREVVLEETAANAVGSVLGSAKFLADYRADAGVMRRVIRGMRTICRSLANKSILAGGDDSAGFTLTFREALEYKRRFEAAHLASAYHLEAEWIERLEAVLEDRDREEEELAEKGAGSGENTAENKNRFALTEEQKRKAEEKMQKSLRKLDDFFRQAGIARKELENLPPALVSDEDWREMLEYRRETERARREKTDKPRFYRRKDARETLESILREVIPEITGARAEIRNADMKQLINKLWETANRENGANDRLVIASRLADAMIAAGAYEDVGASAAYYESLTDGTREEYTAVRSYLNKLDLESLSAEMDTAFGKRAEAVRKRWAQEKGGLSPEAALRELQEKGLLTDVSADNRIDILRALDKEYRELKKRSALRPELLPLDQLDAKELKSLRIRIAGKLLDMFEEAGRETDLGRVKRQYEARLANREDQLRRREIRYQEWSEEQRKKYQGWSEEQKKKYQEWREEQKKKYQKWREEDRKRYQKWREEERKRSREEKKELQKDLQKRAQLLLEQNQDRFAKRLQRIYEETAHAREYWKQKAREARDSRDNYFWQMRVAKDVRTLRDAVKGDYEPSDAIRDPVPATLARLIVKSASATRINVPAAVQGAKVFADWVARMDAQVRAANPEDSFIGPEHYGNRVSQETYDAARLLASSQSQDNLTTEELKALDRIVKSTIQLYHSYDKVFRDGKWSDVREYAERGVRIAQEGIREAKGRLAGLKRAVSKFVLTFMDPLSVAAHMDGYRYDGLMQELTRDIMLADARNKARQKELRAPFEKFLADHKDYEKKLIEEHIEVEGIEITLGEAISLSELWKRNQAKAALAMSRLGFRDNITDSVRRIEGYAAEAKIRTPNGKSMTMREVRNLLYLWNHDRNGAVEALKSMGYKTERAEAEESIEAVRKSAQEAEDKAQQVIDAFASRREKMILGIRRHFDEDDEAFIRLVSDFFNKTSTEIKKAADLRNVGYSNVVSDYYFPISRSQSDMAGNLADGSFFSNFLTVQNLSFNQSLVPGANASIEVRNAWNVVMEHIKALSMYENLYLPIQNLNKIWNKNIGVKTNVLSMRTVFSERTELDYNRYLSDLMMDIQESSTGVRRNPLSRFGAAVQSSYAVSQLGLNPQTIVKQSLSWVGAMQYLKPRSMIKGIVNLTLNADKLDRYSAAAAERTLENADIRAYSGLEKVSQFAELSMKGISWGDRKVNQAIWAAAQYEAAETFPDAPIGSEKNLEKAGQLTDDIILCVQDSSDAGTKSMAARSGNALLRGFTMFQSSGLKLFSRLVENFGFLQHYRGMAKIDAQKYGGAYAQAKKQFGRTLGVFAGTAVMTAVILQLFKFLYNKDREDKNGNEISLLEDFSMDTLTEAVGVIPVAGEIMSYFAEGYDVGHFAFDLFNDTLRATQQIFTLAEKAVTGEPVESWEVGSALRNTARTIGLLTGLPVRNVSNTLSGLVRRLSPETGYAYDTLFYNANYMEDINRALEKGDTEFAEAIASLMLKRNRTGTDLEDRTLELLIGLYNAGYNVLPREAPRSVTVNGEERTLTRSQYRRFRETYSRADEVLEALSESEAFREMAAYAAEDSSPQQRAVRKLYDSYYELAEHDVLGSALSRDAAYILLVDPEKLMLVTAYNEALRNGSAEAAGTRKAALRQYMTALGLSEEEIAYTYYAMGFRGDGLKNQIKNLLQGRKDGAELSAALGLDEKTEVEEKERTA